MAWLACLLSVVGLFGCNEADTLVQDPSVAARTANTARQQAPDFELLALDGSSVRLSDYRGKVVVLNFWATWCGPCRIEAPSLQRLYQTRQETDFELLAVSLDTRREPVDQFVSRYGLEFPVLLDLDQTVAKAYDVISVPLTLLIDRQGRIAVRIDGMREWDGVEWRETIARLSAE